MFLNLKPQEGGVISFGGVLEFSFLVQHLFEISRHKSHFIISGIFKMLSDLSDSTICTLKASSVLFFSSLLELVSLDLRTTKSFLGR